MDEASIPACMMQSINWNLQEVSKQSLLIERERYIRFWRKEMVKLSETIRRF
jgi:hypothetical protein